MFNLPPLTYQSLLKLQEEIDNLHRGGSKAEPKPHKLIMLLVVIEMADRGLLQENKIYYDETLRKIFNDYFELLSNPEDWAQPGPPFFHLRTSDFWYHKIKIGQEAQYMLLKTSGGGHKIIEENIEYAYLSDYAYRVISDNTARKALRDYISVLANPNRSS